jgi:hypothetical protein
MMSWEIEPGYEVIAQYGNGDSFNYTEQLKNCRCQECEALDRELTKALGRIMTHTRKYWLSDEE